MNTTPRPALVTRDAARPLPRLALLLLCAAYVLPGLFGRDPWRGGDLGAFGQMLAIAEGRSSWLAPTLGGVDQGAALLPHWLGAAAILAGRELLGAELAARLPFALLLALALAAVWYACFHLACRDEAQPLPLAFGGEAPTVDYARAIADGALLALIATLGLLQLGHETTPELAQLAAVAGWQWALAAGPRRGGQARLAAVVSLPVLAGCGAPVMALALGIGALLLAAGQRDPGLRALRPWLAAATLLAALLAWPTHSWAWRAAPSLDLASTARLLVWFTWPAWPLVLWTLWHWRRQWQAWHLALPAWTVLVALAACLAMGGHDRALMLGLPGLAVLAAFALPTLQRGASAAVDWFSVFLFTACALTIWVMYVAMQTGVPARPAANIAKLAVGFQPSWSPLALLLALAGTLAWAWLVRWRTGRHRAALWKSLVLPAGGVALCWLLLMTLWLPLLDYARSNRPLGLRLRPHLQQADCVAAPGASATLVATIEWHVQRPVDARREALQGRCPVALLVQRGAARPALLADAEALGWTEVARERRPTDRQEWTLVLRRPVAGATPDATASPATATLR